MINLKKVLLTALATTAVLGLAAVPAHADEVSKETTDLGIKFDTDGPNKPGEGPFRDNLAIAWAPSKMDFGNQKATGNIATYKNTVTDPQYLVVNDDRKTANDQLSPWKVSASLSKLTTEDPTDELAAKLTFNLNKVEKYDIGEIVKGTDDYAPAPLDGESLSEFAGDDSIELGDKNQSNAVSLEADGTSSAAILAKNTTNNLKGGFATKITDTKLIVTTTKAAAGKSYKATLAWSLDNTY